MVLQTTPPQPRSNDLAITLALVPGGPEPSRNGLSNSIPVTVVFREGMKPPASKGPDNPHRGVERKYLGYLPRGGTPRLPALPPPGGGLLLRAAGGVADAMSGGFSP